MEKNMEGRRTSQGVQKCLSPQVHGFSKTRHRALIKQSSMESVILCWWSLPRNMGGRWP